MEPIIVKIDTKSIVKNKNRGETCSFVRTNSETTFTASELPDFFVDGKNCIITCRVISGDKIPHIEGIILDPSLIDLCIKKKVSGIRINTRCNNIPIYHAPVPMYSFKYKKAKVTCNYCGKKILVSDLESEESHDREYYSDKVCPYCGVFECCSIIYETIDEVIKRDKLRYK